MIGAPVDKGWRPEAPPLQGRGMGWGLSVEQLRRLHERAAEMRRNPTEPEKRLWRNLSNGQLGGFKFRRQSVIGWYVADFLCPQRALILEVDGDTHDERKDRLRDDVLGKHGFRVVRVTNDDVMRNMDGVLQHILMVLTETPPRWNNPHPNPSPEGEGLSDGQTSPSPSGKGLGWGMVAREKI
ncbi:MAG: endonuclease domain-containing protein [Alphaproteobacteria bacterium]|nr:endonuclease domain-containing protein [Alphaproteobacteria bacterium]MBV9372138.1 endonuclease domain-containing protein [Alphaproteobacteria bacterium]MBV9901890.1 endonuclease domain-containing protein [Alphaproteobacteria bacterium]